MFKLLLFIMAVLTLQSCSQEDEQAKEKKTKKGQLVEVQPAKLTKMSSYINLTGTIEPNIFSNVRSPANGTIDILHARENKHVSKGQLIAVINPTQRESLISENQLKIVQIENKLKTTDENSSAYNILQEELEEAKSDLEYAKNMYQPISVISPMNGLVTQRYLDEGSQTEHGDNIIKISDMGSLVVKTSVNEKYFEAIKTGRKLPVILNAYPNDTLSGRISQVYPQIDSKTRSVHFDIKIIDFNKRLLPGMMAFIKVEILAKEDAVAVPEHAVLTSPDNKRFLFITDNNNIAHRRVVETGMVSDDNVEIKNGLIVNEKVVISGQEMLEDGMKVKLLK